MWALLAAVREPRRQPMYFEARVLSAHDCVSRRLAGDGQTSAICEGDPRLRGLQIPAPSLAPFVRSGIRSNPCSNPALGALRG